MDTISIPATLDVDPTWNILTMLKRRVDQDPNETLIEVQQPDGSWSPVSASQFDSDVVTVAKGLVALGVAIGDRIAIMSRTSYDWAVLDYAI